MDTKPIDLNINLNNYNKSKPNISKRKHKRLKKNYMNSLQSYQKQIEDSINSEPNPEDKFLSAYERNLPENDEYFVKNTDEDFLTNFEISSNISPKEKFMLQNLLKQHRNQFVISKDRPDRKSQCLETLDQYRR